MNTGEPQTKWPLPYWAELRVQKIQTPHRIELVGLRPARRVLHIPGVDQLDRQARSFRQVEEWPPVITGALEHHLVDPQRPEVISQL